MEFRVRLHRLGKKALKLLSPQGLCNLTLHTGHPPRAQPILSFQEGTKGNLGETESSKEGKRPLSSPRSRVLWTPALLGTMSRSSQPCFTGRHAAVPPSYDVAKEEHEVAVLGAPQISAPVTTTVVNIRPETAVPDHVVWSLFNTLFFNVCCLGFVAFAYSVKVGGCLWACQESGFELWGLLPRWPVMGEPFCLCMWVWRPQGGC